MEPMYSHMNSCRSSQRERFTNHAYAGVSSVSCCSRFLRFARAFLRLLFRFFLRPIELYACACSGVRAIHSYHVPDKNFVTRRL